MRLLLIEDEPIAQQELKRMLKKLKPEAEIVAVIDSVEDAVKWFNTNPVPDLIFLDIELSDGTSFEIFKKVNVTAPIIFTTAYNEYALKAFRLHSIDYLLKPVEEDALEAALNKLESLKSELGGKEQKPLEELDEEDLAALGSQTRAIGQSKFQELLTKATKEYKTRFLVNVGERIQYVEVKDVAYFFAQDNTVFVVTNQKKQYIVNYNLESLESLLEPKTFFRLSRKYIANIQAIGDIYKHFNSRLKVNLIPPVADEILVSRIRVPEFLKWLDN